MVFHSLIISHFIFWWEESIVSPRLVIDKHFWFDETRYVLLELISISRWEKTRREPVNSYNRKHCLISPYTTCYLRQQLVDYYLKSYNKNTNSRYCYLFKTASYQSSNESDDSFIENSSFVCGRSATAAAANSPVFLSVPSR